jgi:cyclomaltodextrinase
MKNQLLEEIRQNSPFLGIDPVQEDYSQTDGLSAPEWVHEGVLYEVFVRSFSEQGTFTGVTAKLDYLRELGVKTIWLMPIHPIGKKDRKGKYGSPYSIRDFLAIEAELGSEADFRKLISEVHKRDMRIVMDLVANHTSNDHHALQGQPELFDWHENGDIARKHPDWTDISDLDYRHPDTVEMMLAVAEYWVREFDIDGWRCDSAGMVPVPFWEKMAERLIKIKPDVLLLAEWENARHHVAGFQVHYDWSLYHLMRDIHNGKRAARQLVDFNREKAACYPRNSYALRFCENHDFPRTVTAFGRESFFPFIAATFTLPGIPLLYTGQENGLAHLPSIFEKDPVNWNDIDHTAAKFYRKLIEVRYANPDFKSNEVEWLPVSADKNIAAFRRGTDTVVILNFAETDIQIETKNMFSPVQDLFTGETVQQQKLKLGPHAVKIFRAV